MKPLNGATGQVPLSVHLSQRPARRVPGGRSIRTRIEQVQHSKRSAVGDEASDRPQVLRGNLSLLESQEGLSSVIEYRQAGLTNGVAELSDPVLRRFAPGVIDLAAPQIREEQVCGELA